MAAADDGFLFRDLLRDQMQRDGRNARKLAADTNKSWDHIPGYLSVEKSTIRNWVRNNDPSTPRNWIQLAVICKELDVTRQIAEAMFLATTREMVLDDLRNKTGDFATELLTFRNELALVSSKHQLGDSTSVVAVSNRLAPSISVLPAGGAKRSHIFGVVAVVCLIAIGSFFAGQQTRPNNAAPAAPTIETTTTQPAPTGPPQITIEGASTVECWGDHETYTAVQTGGETFTEWVWETGSLGLQTPWNVGPEAVLSFTTVPGTYTLKLVNPGEGVIAEKQIELTPALGCNGDPKLPQPSIRGPGQVACGSEGFYRVENVGAEIAEASWTSDSINITEPTPTGAELTFPTKPGLYTVTLRVNQGLTTSRTFTVNTGTLCQV